MQVASRCLWNKPMPINPKDMVGYARAMLKNDSSEMELRNIVNRAYYGAFLTARDMAGIASGGGSVHREVMDYYGGSRVSNNLKALKRLRQVADYIPQATITFQNARASCRKARSVLDDLEA